ncbi:lipid droplet phospholipase 1-like [Typha angustifolia]|uniref:lipid droplet phospholipase 1-like n=1 Tax=Typha angustifolia TaxID=59011 RepID=UPI003C2C73FC
MAMVEDGGKKGRKTTKYLRRLSCFKAADEPAASAGGDGGVGSGERRTPSHLVVTVNGIIGSAENWRFAKKQFLKKYPEDVIVLCSACNTATKTLDGIDIMGERLAKEVMSFITDKPELRRISFVGHSLGGLIARYAIGLLYEKDVPGAPSADNNERDFNAHETQSINKKFEGKIAGLEPMNFITFATPHLGSRFHKQIPILGGFSTLEKAAYRTCGILRRTGKHLFLKDNKEGKPPLLLQMLNDCGDLRFMSALQSFKRHVAYANACSDLIVGWKTSSIRRKHELPKRENFMKNEKYPHIVNVEKPNSANTQQDSFTETMIYQAKSASEMEETMIKGLNRVPWERVDVSFRRSKQRVFAHSTIQVKTYFLNSDGADVIFHMIDYFLL